MNINIIFLYVTVVAQLSDSQCGVSGRPDRSIDRYSNESANSRPVEVTSVENGIRIDGGRVLSRLDMNARACNGGLECTAYSHIIHVGTSASALFCSILALERHQLRHKTQKLEKKMHRRSRFRTRAPSEKKTGAKKVWSVGRAVSRPEYKRANSVRTAQPVTVPSARLMLRVLHT